MASTPRNTPSIAVDGDIVVMTQNPVAASLLPHRTTMLINPAYGPGDGATPTGPHLQKQTTVGQTQVGLDVHGALDDLAEMEGSDRTSSVRHKAKNTSVLHRKSTLFLNPKPPKLLPVQDRLTDYLLYNAAEDVENKWNSQSHTCPPRAYALRFFQNRYPVLLPSSSVSQKIAQTQAPPARSQTCTSRASPEAGAATRTTGCKRSRRKRSSEEEK